MIYIGTKEITEVPKIQPSNPVPILRKVNIIASTSVRATMTEYTLHTVWLICVITSYSRTPLLPLSVFC